LKFLFLPGKQLPKDSKVKCDQIRTIDKSRFLSEVGKLSEEYIVEIEFELRRHLDM
jgi:mRNA interferase MazF